MGEIGHESYRSLAPGKIEQLANRPFTRCKPSANATKLAPPCWL